MTSKGKTRTLIFYALGTVLTVAVFFSFIELTTRVVSLVRGNGFFLALHEFDATDDAITSIYQFHPFTGFVFKPNQTLYGSHPRQPNQVRIQTDEHGFLSDVGSLPLAKRSNEIRIAAIGGSTTANVNLAYADNWPGRIGEMIQARFKGHEVTVINAGVPGYDTAQSVGNLALRVMPFNPDLVIIYHAYNDLKVVRADFDIAPDYSNVHDRPYGQFERPNPVVRLLNHSMFYVRARNSYRELKRNQANVAMFMEEGRLDSVPDEAAAIFEHNIRTMVAIARSGGAEVILSSFATLHELDVDTALRAVTPMKKQELIELIRFTPGLTLRGILAGIGRYNAILKRVAEDLQTGWVDNAQLVPNRDEFFLDRVHVSSAGAAKMAENFLPAAVVLIENHARQATEFSAK